MEYDNSFHFSDYPETNYPDFGPEYSYETRLKLHQIIELVAYFSKCISPYTILLAIIGIILNSLHFGVLTRKSLMKNSINLILAILALNDIFGFLLLLHVRGMFISLDTYPNGRCFPNDTMVFELKNLIKLTFLRYFARNASWLAVLMAGIRTLCMLNFDNPRFSTLTTIKFGAFAIFLTLAASLVVSSYVFVPFIFKGLWDPSLDFVWKQKGLCPESATEKTKLLHTLNYSENDRLNASFLDALSITIIPALIYPFFTFFLVKSLRKQKRRRNQLGANNGNKDHSTAIVIAMTASFMVAEIPRSLAFFTQQSTNFRMNLLGHSLMNIFSNLTYFNSSIHLFICFALSSAYRNTVCDIFRIRKRKHKIDRQDVETTDGTAKN